MRTLSSLRVASLTLSAFLLSMIVAPASVVANDLDSVIKKSVVIIEGPSGTGSGVVVGRKGNTYLLLTSAHVVGGSRSKGDEADVSLPSGGLSSLKVIKFFDGVDVAVATFETTNPYVPLPINAFLPYPAPNTAEERSPELNLKSPFLTITRKGRVAGYSLPTKTVKTPIFRVIDIQLVDKASGNTDGYNLLYQASTVRGMSGGPVMGFRDCSNSGGFALGISPNSVFPVLLGVHGRSEEYGDGEGRSGISLGIPVEGSLAEYLKSIRAKYGVPAGEKEIRLLADEHFCLNPTMTPEMQKYMQRMNSIQSKPGKVDSTGMPAGSGLRFGF